MNQEVFLSVIVPVYNEAEIIKASLQNKLHLLEQKNYHCELIVVNDASTDNSEQIILQIQHSGDSKMIFTYLKNETNLGFGGAISKGISAAKGKNILCLPADLVLGKEKLDEIILLLETNEVVACYRNSKPGNSIVSQIGSKIYQGLIRIIFGLKVRDINWAHAYRKNIFTEGSIQPHNSRIFFLAEVLIKAHWKNFRIAEVVLEPQERLNRKGVSQSFVTFLKAMSDLFFFSVQVLLKGKRSDL